MWPGLCTECKRLPTVRPGTHLHETAAELRERGRHRAGGQRHGQHVERLDARVPHFLWRARQPLPPALLQQGPHVLDESYTRRAMNLARGLSRQARTCLAVLRPSSGKQRIMQHVPAARHTGLLEGPRGWHTLAPRGRTQRGCSPEGEHAALHAGAGMHAGGGAPGTGMASATSLLLKLMRTLLVTGSA